MQTPETLRLARVPAREIRQPVQVRKRRLWIWGAIALGILAAVFLVYSQFWTVRIKTVAVEISRRAPVTRVLAVNGQIAAVRSVTVRPLVSGTLDSLLVDEGETVAAGQVMGLINADNQNAVVRQAMAGLDAALEAQQQATRAYDRALELGSNIARTVLESEDHAKQSAIQEVARQTAVLDQSYIALQNHTIRAPIAGSVLVTSVDLGQLVDRSTSLLALADLRELVVETDVDEAYARQIALDQPAILQLAGETSTRSGRVTFVSDQVDVATGALAVRIVFDAMINAPVGLSVTTNIVVEQLGAALTLPRTSLVTGEAGFSVFVVDGGIAQLRPVSVTDWPAARLIVTSGLSEGDVVVMDAEGLEDGASVDAVQR